MSVEFSEDEFMKACGLNQEEWDLLNDSRATLHAIFTDFKKKHDQFTEIAVSLSRLIQKLPGVHSVRWRIKDPHHLVKKIARKKAAAVEKYATISPENYRDVVTDLIGIRALHLFKGDFPTLHRSIIETWELDENPVAYVRKGDTEELRTLYRELELEVEEHKDGYRSIHYITKTNFTKTTVKCELQVRTIFEEGWSEIDHKVRYPDFSNDPLIRDFLHIFNRLSGAADEMGTFVNRLAADLTALTAEQATAVSRASEIEAQLSEKIQKIEALSSKNTSMQSEMKELKSLIARQKAELSIQIGSGGLGSSALERLHVNSDLHAVSDILRTLNISPSLYGDAVSASKNIIDASKIAADAVKLVTKKKE
ncbi:RelA/SpoT domain-containing protein [Shinella daejeonensis]|uniref:RelA/SpoT domain-containing protein n=1 Tax=Shinella daejeonensis TaxID=659017 RepID=UPI0020C772FB|nr:RelA/SpoT domain-containing protein [Shinella daejeonensis]